MEELIKKIIECELAASVTAIEEIVGKGKSNRVFKVGLKNVIYILRVQKSLEILSIYQKEMWCAKVAQEAGIPTPKIISVGLRGEYAFSIQEFVEGVSGADSKEYASDIWYALGNYAKIMHRIPAPDFIFNYKNYVDELFAENFFVSQNIFSEELSSKINMRTYETSMWAFAPQLCHGNLHPSNVVVGLDGVIHLIDWETASGNRAPHKDLGEIYTWNTGKENIAYFLDGYGLEEGAVKEIMRDIQTLILLRIVGVLKQKIIQGDEVEYVHKTIEKLSEIQDYHKDILFTKNI